MDDAQPKDPSLRALLEELGRALCDAIEDSPEVHQQLQRIRDEGYTLHLLLDCKRRPAEASEESAEDPATQPISGIEARPSRAADASFQINATDLSFLRSIGIDPTRHLRRRRGQ